MSQIKLGECHFLKLISYSKLIYTFCIIFKWCYHIILYTYYFSLKKIIIYIHIFEAVSDEDILSSGVLVLPKCFGTLFLFTGSKNSTRPLANALGDDHK